MSIKPLQKSDINRYLYRLNKWRLKKIKNKKYMKKTHLFLIAALMLGLMSCGSKDKQESNLQYVKIGTATKAEAQYNLSYPGRTKPSEDINLSFRVSGPILKMFVKEGDHVKKGQIIAQMDPRDYETQLSATTAEYEQIKGDAERIEALYKEGNTTASNYDKARYGFEQITAKLNNSKHQLADTRLYAPIDGYIESKMHDAGETVAAGMPIVSIFGSGATEVEINITASDYQNRDRFGSFYCTFDLFPDKKFPLELVRINQDANANQLYNVRLRLKDGAKGQITPGMTTMVYINMKGGESEPIVIPTTAIFSENDKTFVFIYQQKSGTVEKRAVTLKHLRTDGFCEISSGLRENESIVTAGVHEIENGQKVRTLPKVSKTNVGGLL